MYAAEALESLVEAKNKPRALESPQRGLSREQSARYIGVSPSTFDLLVKDGLMPNATKVRSRSIWDVRALDLHFDRLTDQEPTNPWNDGMLKVREP